jgi:hypothetical protein
MVLNKTFMIVFFALILVSMLNVVSAATVYKWIDEDGHVHYGSRPDNKNAEEIEIKNRYIDSGNVPPPLSAEDRVEKQKRFIDALDAENRSISSEKKKKRAQAELKVTRCHASRDQLRRYESSGSLYDLDEKGNRILLNKKQYDQAMQQARARVEKWCN